MVDFKEQLKSLEILESKMLLLHIAPHKDFLNTKILNFLTIFVWDIYIFLTKLARYFSAI